MATNGIFRQRKIKGIGAFFNLLYLCLPILSLFSAVGIGLTTYATFIITYMPWLPFWLYILAVALAAIFVMFLFWVFVYQGYFYNPIGQNIVKIMRKMGIEEE